MCTLLIGIGILRAALQLNQGHVGVYATVVRGGTIRDGDQVRLKGDDEKRLNFRLSYHEHIQEDASRSVCGSSRR